MMQLQKPKRPTFFSSLGRFLFLLTLTAPFLSFSEEEKTSPDAEVPEPKDSKFFISTDVQIRLAARPVLAKPFDYPALGLVGLNVGYDASEKTHLQLSGFAGVPVQVSLPRADAFADLGDSYLRISQSEIFFKLGYLRLPWQVLRASAINDRLNPIDYRRGVDFPGDVSGRVPQWGLQVKGSLGGAALEGVYFIWHRPNPSTLFFDDQNGVQIGHYQGGLANTKKDLLALVAMTSLPIERQGLSWFLSPTFALKTRRQIDDFDLSANAVWGYDEVPVVKTQPSRLLLSSGRSLSVGADATWLFGVVILKAEAVFTPQIGEDIGKVTILKSGNAITSKSLTSAVFGIGAEAEYGEALSGSFELIDTLWFGVPPGHHVYTIEEDGAQTSENRLVQRLALALAFSGDVFGDALKWNFRGEVGLLRPDILAALSVRHEFSDTGFYVGVYTQVFNGVFQGAGWSRANATEVGLQAGFRL